MKKVFLITAAIAVLAGPAMADDVGVRVGPVGAGVTVGDGHDRDRDRETIVKEREPRERDRTTVIKKEDEDGNRSFPSATACASNFSSFRASRQHTITIHQACSSRPKSCAGSLFLKDGPDRPCRHSCFSAWNEGAHPLLRCTS
jgi:hypothetical protein